MLIKMECTQCGALLDVDDSKEHFFCTYCGNKIVNLPRERITKSQTVHVVQRVGGDATNPFPVNNNIRYLVISYGTVDSSIGLQVIINETRQTIYVARDEVQYLALPVGEYDIQVLFGRRGYSRVLRMPENNVAIQMDCYHGSPNRINIFSIPIGKYMAMTGKAVDFGEDFIVKPNTGYLHLVRRLESLGFTNIAAFPCKDLGWKQRNKNGCIESIVIGGKVFEVDRSYGAELEGYYPFDVEITMGFHSMANGNDVPYYVKKGNVNRSVEPVVSYPTQPVIVEYTTTTNETRDIYEYGGVTTSSSQSTVVQPMQPGQLSGNSQTMQQADAINRQQATPVAPQRVNNIYGTQEAPPKKQENESVFGFVADTFNEMFSEVKNAFSFAPASPSPTNVAAPPMPQPVPQPIVKPVSNPIPVAAAVVGAAATTVASSVSNTNSGVGGRTINEYRNIPTIYNRACKGQKTVLGAINGIHNIKVCFGWNYNDDCEVNVSSFFLKNGQIVEKGWFMCNEKLHSPDNSVYTITNDLVDRKILCINLDTMNRDVDKVAFAITVDKSMHGNNFKALKDMYVRIINCDTGAEAIGYMPEDYSGDISTMIIGEIYKNNGAWKFNAAGNGMSRDIMGLRKFYGAL